MAKSQAEFLADLEEKRPTMVDGIIRNLIHAGVLLTHEAERYRGVLEPYTLAQIVQVMIVSQELVEAVA